MSENDINKSDKKHRNDGPEEVRRVLVAMDGSEHSENALKWFINTMHKRGDYIILVHVMEYKSLLHGPTMTTDVNMISRMLEEEQKNVRLLEARLREILNIAGIKGNVKQLHGQPGEQIVNAASKEGADFIVTGCRGMGALRRTFLGSVSDYIVHHSPMPVLICRND